ncbi:Trp biosynthesis-associated membrane protein [Cutibacterium sp.]|uniref:Trp biosynthesis-associated membrane protein n=1 Tax=Cutibacterium sp. TaxID=1912221 RepID=UPI0026DC98C7|nr:Trp biosynthesis-associated membrane protein [Cutibacterium sp.]MDO4411940.1 Trp biosynthesis-associated membrane protein [Cutibacterium sp.]
MVAAIFISVASRRTWMERAGIGLTGTDVTGGLITVTTLMLVITAALILVVKTAGRRVTGILQALVGAGIVGVVLTHRTASDHQWAMKGVDAGAAQMTVTAWPWMCLVAGALAVLTGLGLVVFADRWPSRSARHTGADSRSIWDALDRGEDPTVTKSPSQAGRLTPAEPESSDTAQSDFDQAVHKVGNSSNNGRQARVESQSG